ncbi:MAG: type VI secretion system protein, partial [Pseudomonadota bacterium]
MDIYEIMDEIANVLTPLGGVPTFVFVIFGFVFAAMAVGRLYKLIVPKMPKKPKAPKIPPAQELAKGPDDDDVPDAPQAAAAQPGAAKTEDADLDDDDEDDEEEIDEKTGKPKKKKRSFWPFELKRTAKKRISLPKLRETFRHNLRQLQDNVSGLDARYDIPWFLMVGEYGAGKSTVLGNTNLPQPLGQLASEDPNRQRTCEWWCFNKGVVLDVPGECILYQEEETGKYRDDDRGWHEILKLLQKNRTRRPVDGIILTIPASDLIDNSPLENEELIKKADRLYKKLWRAQKAIGMRLPVYIMITKADQINGFRNFCNILPDRFEDEMFGWSNPYPLEKVYNTNLIDEAFQHIYQDLNEIQLELVTAINDIPDNDEFLLFPHELRPVFNRLRTYLDNVFKPSAMHEPFFFRGIYLTGDAGPKSLPLMAGGAAEDTSDTLPFEPDSSDEGYRPRPVFTTQLLDSKVFPEGRIARPVEKAYQGRRKLLYAAQGAIVTIAGIGIATQWYAFNSLHNETESIKPVLHSIIKDSATLREMTRKVEFDDSYFAELKHLQQQSALDVLNGFANIESDWLSTIWIPSSWFSNIDMQIKNSLSRAYEDYVLDWMYQGFHLRARTLVYDDNPDADEIIDGEIVEEQPQFIALKRYVTRLNELQSYVFLYNDLKNTEDQADAIGRLVAYLY